MRGSVTIEGDSIRLWGDGRLLDAHAMSDLIRICDVRAGSDIDLANPDCDFHVFSFREKIWVLPEETEGVSTVIFKTWRDYISKSKIYYFADLPELPRPWRRPWLGGLVRIREPQLLVLPSTDVPNWRLHGPVEPGTIPPPELFMKEGRAKG